MGYPERLLTDDETILRQFRPHWRVFLPVVAWALLFAAVAGVVVWFDARGSDHVLATGPVAVVAAVVLTAVVAVAPFVRWIGTLYVLTTERIVVRQGIVSKSGVEIPLENINNVLFNQSVMERLLGYGDVLIESAGSQGQSRLVDIPDPEAFQSEVYRARELRSVHLEGGPGAGDPVSQLERLGTLLERGLVTQEEYDAKKRDLLDRL